MTDEHLNHYAGRYVHYGIKDCGVSLLQCLANPDRYPRSKACCHGSG